MNNIIPKLSVIAPFFLGGGFLTVVLIVLFIKTLKYVGIILFEDESPQLCARNV